MKLIGFRANNLFSLGDVELDLRDRGLLLITGHSVDEGGANGSGKSSLSNKALLWVLFGSTANGEKADAVANRFRREGEVVSGSIEFESSSGGRFRIIRSRNPNRLLLYDLDADKNISSTTEKDTQATINKLLGRNRETFLQTDFFGQGKAASFLDLTPKAQVELLENILPFERLSELHEKSKIYLVEVKEVLQQYQSRVTETQGQLQESQRQERVLSASIDKWEQDQLRDIQLMTAQYEALQVTGEDAARIRQLESQLESMHNPILTQQMIDAANNKLDTLTPYIKTYKSIIAQLDNDLMLLKPVPAKTDWSCPTCKKRFTPQEAEDHSKKYNEFKEQQNALLTQKKQAQAFLQDVEDQMRDLQINLVDYRLGNDRFNEFQQELNELRNRAENLKLAQLEIAIADAKAAKNPYTEMYEENSTRTNSIVAHINALKSKVNEVTKDVTALEFWVQAFGKELKNELLKQVCPFLEQKSNIHLSALGNPQIKVRFQTTKTLKSENEKNEFTVTVDSSTGGGTYDSLSGGEKQMVGFAVGMALADLAESQVDGPSRLTILDEPFMALDQRNSELVVNYLQSYLAAKKDTILLVSNEESLKMLIPNQIRVVKEHGISRLES